MTAEPLTPHPVALSAADIVVGYGATPVLNGVSVDIPAGSFTAIIGPNACGKSTLLRSFARLIRPSAGEITVAGKPAAALSSRTFARTLALLPQSPVTPEGITVEELVGRGRFAHQGVFRRYSRDDERAVLAAMDAAGVTELRGRGVDELSGGQRQRAWIALTLAQESEIVLLDEPTTFLDIAHQIEVLELAVRLAAAGRTVVAVLHEISLAARYATHLIALRDGAVIAEGDPRSVVTAELVRSVFDVDARVIADPDSGAPVILPRAVVR